MQHKFLKAAGVKTEQEFYNKYPDENSFFSEFPKFKKGGKIKKAEDGMYELPRMAYDPQVVQSQNIKAAQSKIDPNVNNQISRVDPNYTPNSNDIGAMKKQAYSPQTIKSQSLKVPFENPLQVPTDRPEVKNKDGKSIGYKGPSLGVGQMLQGGIGLVNMLLGPEQPRRSVDNTLNYNPFPYGTGSQAIAKDGMLMDGGKKNKKELKNTLDKNYQYNGIVDSTGKSVDNPTYLQAIQTMADYMKNNNPDSNVYHPEWQHISVEDRSINQDYAEFGSVIDKPKKPKKGQPIPVSYDKYSGAVDEKGDHFNFGNDQWIHNMGEYMKNNNPDSNIYRPEYQHHSVNTPEIQPFNSTTQLQPVMAKNGKVMYGDGGLQTHNGGNAPQVSHNPFDGGMGEFKGDSHANGGIEASYNGKPFEAEGGEPYRIDTDGNLEIFGNLTNPVTGNKFKKDGKILASKEKKTQSYLDKGLTLVNDTDPGRDKFAQMTFNSGKAMMEGGIAKQKELAASKEHLSMLQRMMLQQEEQTHARNGMYMSFEKGGTMYANGGGPGDDYTAIIKKYAEKYGVNPTTISKIINTESGFNPNAVSKVGAKGIMQFMPKTAASYGLNKNSSVEDNIEAGVKHFSSLLKQNHGDETLALGAYNMGQGNLNKFIKSSGKKANDYTGEDLIQRLDYKNKNQPSNNPNLAQNQTRSYIQNIQGQKPNPEQFREEYYTPKGTPINKVDVTSPDYQFNTQLKSQVEDTNYTKPTAKTFNLTNPVDKLFQPTKHNLPWEQIAPAIPQIFDRPDYVAKQSYNPELYTPYQVSFQDRINQNSKNFNALAPSLVGNAEAQGSLAGQLYSANNSVMADEFRTNQGITDDITNKNISLINDAKLKNIQLSDTQYVRQAQAKSNTRDRQIDAGIHIGDVIAKNNLENKTLDVTRQLYKDYAYDKNMQLQYVGNANAGDQLSETGSGISGKVTSTEVTSNNKNDKTSTKQTYKPNYDFGNASLFKNYKSHKNGGKVTQSQISKLMYN